MREPKYAGSFYPRKKEELVSELNMLFDIKTPYFEDALGIIVPHAGYIFSGPVAAKVYNSIYKTEKRNFVILGVDHGGKAVVATSNQNWLTPIGEVKVDTDFVDKITKEHAVILDDFALEGEHSIEVQLPFLQYLFKEFKFVPVQVPRISYKEILNLANLLADKNHFFIATSDFIHYGLSYGFMPQESFYDPEDYVRKLDFQAIEKICNLDSKGFLDFVRERDLPICGTMTISLLIEIAKILGAKKVEKLAYDTSLSVTKDISNVVGYGGLVFRS